MGTFSSDLRFVLRSISRSPGFAAIVVLTLAVGIGASAAIFSVINAVLLKPLPYESSEDLVAVWGRFDPESGFDFPVFPLSNPEFVDYWQQNTTMEDVAAFSDAAVTITGFGGDAERIPAARVSANLFELLRVAPESGRLFSVAEDLPGGPQVALLSAALHQSRFGGDAGLVGRTVPINGVATEILGIMPPGFSFPNPDTRLWLPLRVDPGDPGNRQAHSIRALARLATGSSLREAQTEVEALMARWKVDYPDIHTGHYLFLHDYLDFMTRNVRPALLIALVAVGFVLLIVCANIANVLLARGELRLKEIAVRASMGAGRWRLVRLLMTESAVLALLGGLLGIGLGRVGLLGLSRLEAGSIPRAGDVALDPSVLGFALLISLATALLFGLLPSLHATSGELNNYLREGGRGLSSGRTGLRFRRGLVVAEVALAFLLTLGAGLMLKSFSRLVGVDPGFRAEGLLVASLSLPSSEYPDGQRVQAFYRPLLEHLRALPGVESASAVSNLPLWNSPGVNDFEIEGRPTPGQGGRAWNASYVAARVGFFETFGVPLRRGRVFSEGDASSDHHVAVISESMADTFFAGKDPLGQRLRMSSSPDDPLPWLEIVGVVGDVTYGTLDQERFPAYYFLHEHSATTERFAHGFMTLVVRTEGDPMMLTEPLRQAVRSADANLPLIGLQTMAEVVATSVARPRFTTTLIALFGGVALLLGAAGIYGVLAYTVALQAREIGIRMALGAGPSRVASLVLRQGMAPALLGLFLGVLAWLGLARLVTGLLFDVAPGDPLALVLVSIVLMLSACLACWLPAQRATRLDPIATLKAE